MSPVAVTSTRTMARGGWFHCSLEAQHRRLLVRKKIVFAARLEQRPTDIVLLQEISNRGDVATKLSGYNDCLQASLGAVVALPFWCATLCRASACRSLALTSWRPLLSVYFRRAVAAFAWRVSTTLPQQLVNNPHLSISFVACARRDYRG
ncbi:hypothetical protein TcCL_NonESM03688 [Trypanosoma cruzi]|nr:hypothetical protein TcCL_NonESM03688 [Trypanosoma cruzi]